MDINHQVIGKIKVAKVVMAVMVEMAGMTIMEVKKDANLIEIVTIPKDVMEGDVQLLILVVLIAGQTKNVPMENVFLMTTQAVDQIVIARTMKHASEEFA